MIHFIRMTVGTILTLLTPGQSPRILFSAKASESRHHGMSPGIHQGALTEEIQYLLETCTCS